MPKYLFYIKECLFNPSIFFKHQKENPSIIQMPWILVPIIVFLFLVLVHWISNTVITNNIKLDFEGYILVHIGHLFVGFVLTLIIWLRTWFTLKYIGKIKDFTPAITAWCITPYLPVLLFLILVLMVYMPIFSQATQVPIVQNVTIAFVQHGTSLIKGAALFSDIWIIFLIFTAVSTINPARSRSSLVGSIIIFLLPNIVFITFR